MSQSKFSLRAAAASAALIAAPYAFGQEAVEAGAQAASQTAAEAQAQVDASTVEANVAADEAAKAEAAVQDSVKATADAAVSGDANAEAVVPQPNVDRAVDRADAAVDRTSNRAENALERTQNRAENVAAATKSHAQALLRGPVHEAFARPAVAEILRGEVVPSQPPAALNEIAPDAEEGMEFIEGYWSYDPSISDFVWVTGTLRRAPQGAAWVAGEWRQTAEGWLRVPGYWKVAADTQAAVSAQANGAVDAAANASASAASTIDVPPAQIETPDGLVDVPGYVDHSLPNRGVLFAPVRMVDARADRAVDRAQNRAANVADRSQNRVENRLADANDRVENATERASNLQNRAENRLENASERIENRAENAQDRVADLRDDAASVAETKVDDVNDSVRETVDGADAQVEAAAQVAAEAEANVAASSQQIVADAAASSLTTVDGALTLQPTERIAPDSLMLHLFVDEAHDAFYFGDYYDVANQASDSGMRLVHWSDSPATPGSLLAEHEELYNSANGSFIERLAGWNKYFVASTLQRPAHTVEAAEARLSDVSAAKLHQLSHLSQSVSDRAIRGATNLDPNVRVDADLSGDVSADISPDRASADSLQSLNADVQAGRIRRSVEGAAQLNGSAAPNVRVPRNLGTPRIEAPNGALQGGLNGGAGGVGNLGGGLGGAVGGALGK